MDTSKTVDQNLDNFNKLVLDLRNSGKKFEDKDVSVILLNSLLDSFNEVRTAIKYGKDSLTTSIVINAIKSKDFEAQIKKDKFMGLGSGESYYSRGRSPYKRNHSKGKFHSKGRSNIKIKMFDGVVRTLKDVRFVPSLKKNLVSLGQLYNSSLSYKAEGGILKVTKGSMVVIKANRNNGLYEMMGETDVGRGSQGSGLIAEKDSTDLWHCRLRHMSLKRLQFKTPEEVWLGKLPNLSDLKTFGCTAYARNREGKLDHRSIRCVFLGYGDGVKGYRLWSLEPKGAKLIISRDVLFNENSFPYISTATNPAGSSRNENSKKS
ncbi:hypothetical protein UlMin_009643 [Ulmus minor]